MPAIVDPVRLTFMKPLCFYCHANMTGCVQIELYFGIHHCNEHAGAARRDCDAYLHRKGLFPMSRAHEVSPIEKLLVTLDTTPFKLKTSEGYIGGWSVDYGYAGRETYLRYNPAKDVWTVLLYRNVDRDSGRQVSIREILEPITINAFPSDICELVNQVDVLLRMGIYKDAEAAQRRL